MCDGNFFHDIILAAEDQFSLDFILSVVLYSRHEKVLDLCLGFLPFLPCAEQGQ